jgi:hypothetical protein
MGAVLCLFLIGRLIFSDFSVIDDHDLVDWLDKSFWSRIRSTELVQYGFGARYRPFMYLAVICESMVFGPHPMPYHIVQLLWFGVFLSAVAWAGVRSVGLFAGFLLLFMVASGHYWGNIWGNSLFAAEQTGSAGLGLVIFGCGLFCSWFVGFARGPLDRSLLLTSVGTLICVGSKENFIALIPLNATLLAWSWRNRVAGPAALTASLFCVLLQWVICYGILHANLHQLSNPDISDHGLWGRLTAIFRVKRIVLRIFLAWAGGTVTALYVFLHGRLVRSDRKIRELAILSALLIGSGVYVCWEQFFYSGLLPTNYRYDFPALLIDPILAGSAFYVLLSARDRVDWIKEVVNPLLLRTLFFQGCILFIIWPGIRFSVYRDEIFPAHAAIAQSAEHSRARARDLERTRQIVSEHPDWPIVVRASRASDYEAVVSFPSWLRYSHISNSASLEARIDTGKVQRSEVQEVEDMRDISRLGAPGQYIASDPMVPTALAQGHCYVIQFVDAPTPCVRLPYHPGEYFP